MVLQFSLGNKDFSSIFGKQEAEERHQREVEMEFKLRHNVQKKEDASPWDEIDKLDGAEKNTTKKVGKYVPPPTMGTKKKDTGKNITPLLDGNYE
jgi:hypothetical protein